MVAFAKTEAQRRLEARAWAQGDLRYLLDEVQLAMHEATLDLRGLERVVRLAARGLGKTFDALDMCVEACLQKPNQQIAFVTKTKKQARRNTKTSMATILEDCPRWQRPTYNKSDYEYRFRNGSTLILIGVDSERFEDLRGASFDGVVVDEAQDIDQLNEVVRVVLDPAVLRVNGWMLIQGTVPEEDTHEFVEFIHEALAAGRLIIKTILECPRYTPEQIAKFRSRAGGEDSPIWKREYMCELFYSSTLLVVPEMTRELAFGKDGKPGIVREWQVPLHYDRLTTLDPGQRDLDALLFGLWDFQTQVLVIKGERTMKGKNTSVLASTVKQAELEIWKDQSGNNGRLQRYSDTELRLVQDLETEHKLKFNLTAKDNKKAQIASLRVALQNCRIIIDPSCKVLIRTLFGARWNKAHTEFSREDPIIGHADLLDALLYMWRNLRKNSNPFPPEATYSVLVGIQVQPPGMSKQAEIMRDIYNRKPGAKPEDLKPKLPRPARRVVSR